MAGRPSCEAWICDTASTEQSPTAIRPSFHSPECTRFRQIRSRCTARLDVIVGAAIIKRNVTGMERRSHTISLDGSRWAGRSAWGRAVRPQSGRSDVFGPAGPAGVSLLYANTVELAVCVMTGRIVTVTIDQPLDAVGADLLAAFGELGSSPGPTAVPTLALRDSCDATRRLAVAAAHLETAALEIRMGETSSARPLLATERADVLAVLSPMHPDWIPEELVREAHSLAERAAVSTVLPDGRRTRSPRAATDSLDAPGRSDPAVPEDTPDKPLGIELVRKGRQPALRLVRDEPSSAVRNGDGSRGCAGFGIRIPPVLAGSYDFRAVEGPIPATEALDGRARWYRVAVDIRYSDSAAEHPVWVVALDDADQVIGGTCLDEIIDTAVVDVAARGVASSFALIEHPFAAGGWVSPFGDSHAAQALSRVAFWHGISEYTSVRARSADIWSHAVTAWLDAGDVFKAAWAWTLCDRAIVARALDGIDTALVPILEAVVSTGDVPPPGFGYPFAGAWLAAHDLRELLPISAGSGSEPPASDANHDASIADISTSASRRGHARSHR